MSLANPALPRLPGSAAAAAAVAAAVLAACATPGPHLPATAYAGRIAVHSDPAFHREAHSVSGQFQLAGNPAVGQLELTSPLGSVLAQARWSRPDAAGRPTDIQLQAQGHTRRFDDFEEMTRAVLGESLPVPALFDWLAGRPWPGSPASFSAEGRFEQMGWQVDASRLAGEALLDAERPEPPPALHVRVKLDSPAAAAAAVSASLPQGQR